MNQFRIWQLILIYSVLVLGILFAMPNFYPTKPALQIAIGNSSSIINKDLVQELTYVLDENKIEFEDIQLNENSVTVIFDDVESQLASRRVLADYSEGEFIIALNSETTTPEWLKSIGGKPVNLGLDLAGGIYFLLEVDTDLYSEKKFSSEGASLVNELLNRNINSSFESSENEIKLSFTNQNSLNQAQEYLIQNNTISDAGNINDKYIITKSENNLFLSYTDKYISTIIDTAVTQNLKALRQRVNELGISEPVVQKQGTNRIIVELPGVQDSTSAKNIIGKTANLEFRLQAALDLDDVQRALRTKKFSFKNQPARSVFLEKEVILTGNNVTGASSGFDENGVPQVNIELDQDGAKAMADATQGNIGRNLGVVLIEEITKTYFDEEGKVIQEKETVEQVISNATIQDVLGARFRITGLNTTEEARELALLLRAGALAAPMTFAEEQIIGPSLGQDNIDSGIKSLLIGFALVFLFMIIRYRLFGLAANIALVSNLILVTAIMSVFGATLTLPGIAGIVLTVGMAVDANVLIFARISEELKANVDPQNAIKNGFSKAFSTIMDANITTLLVALILYAIGTGPIKGFAVTLSIGIVTSIFTAILVTRSLVNFIYGYRRVEELKI